MTDRLTRREFFATAAALGATAVWAGTKSKNSHGTSSHERRDLFPEGVASGDPHPDSVLLWTRRPFETGEQARLLVEVAADESFKQVIASAPAIVSAASDWTCRVLAGNLEPATVYWYRFTDEMGQTSRVGRTITAPTADDPRPVKFAFISCQNANQGSQHAYRRMIFEDERAPQAAPGLRSAPRRLHLRDRLVSGGPPAGHVRPQVAGYRPLRARRESSGLSYPHHGR